MNIESLIAKTELFNDLIIKSGFRRDLQDYINTIQQAQNQNLVFMKDLSIKIIENLDFFENYSLNEELQTLLKDTKPFTELDVKNSLEIININPEIEANDYFNQFNQLLHQITARIDENIREIDAATVFLSKYSTKDIQSNISDNDQAILSLIFKDLNTITSLKEFSKVLNRWNRTLLIYHSLLKSESPNDISLVEIQNGSIDVIFNFDFDIALDLTELIKTGLKVYAGYLLYKSKTAKEIILSYMGNKKLIEMEVERENLMLDNIKTSIAEKIEEQHKEKITHDKKIDTTSLDVKIEEISSVITDHIVKGNELKLLTPPEIIEGAEKDLAEELRDETAIVRERFKKLSIQEKQLLIDKYSIIEDLNDKGKK